MLPVCSATSCCSSRSQVSFQEGLRPFCPFRQDFGIRCIVQGRGVLGWSNGNHLQRVPLKAQSLKSLYANLVESNEQPISMAFISDSPSVGAINELKHVERGNLKHVYNISAMKEGSVDITAQATENASRSIGAMESEGMLEMDITSENPSLGSNSLDFNNDSLSTSTTNFGDFVAGVKDSIDASVNKGENALKSSLDTLNSSISSIRNSASEVVDSALSKVFSTVNNTGELANNRLSSFSSDLKEALSRATGFFVDVLRGTIVAVEDTISKGASFVVYNYGSAKELLPQEIRSALNLSEERAVQISRPIGTTFQQVYIGIEGLEKSLGLDPNDPVVPFILFLGTSASLWAFYWVRTYSGYSGDISPESTLELLSGKENAVLIDVRPEVLRERDGIPDLRRAARFRYASVSLPEVDGQVRSLLKGGRDLDDVLIAAVIQNLKAVRDSYKVIILDADGTRSKGIARSLRKLGIKRPYLVQGGFQSWAKQGLRMKELKPETTLTILNEEAEAIMEDISPSPIQALGYGVGFVAACYALVEWEKTLQLIGIVGLGQTVYRRVASYEGPEDIKQDVRLLLAPVRLGAQAFSWVAGKLENNRIGLPTSPSSSDVQNRVLQAAAKHESQPSDTEGAQSPPESMSQMTENVDLSEA